MLHVQCTLVQLLLLLQSYPKDVCVWALMTTSV